MDIEQFFTDINIHGRDGKKAYSPGKHSIESRRQKERDISGIYGQLKKNFDNATLKLPDHEA